MKPDEYFLPGMSEPVIRGGAGRIVAKLKKQEPQELESNYEHRHISLRHIRNGEILLPAEPRSEKHTADPVHT